MYDQIRIHSWNPAANNNIPSGVFQIRLNFDDNVNWTTTGSVAEVNARGCLQSFSPLKQSRLTSELINALGAATFELWDSPDLQYTDSGGAQTGNFIRDCFEAARANGYQVHCVIARYSSADPPVFQEFIFAGSMNPYEMPVAHFSEFPSEDRRHETISCEFAPAARLQAPLSEIVWLEEDMEPEVRPLFGPVVCEPGDNHILARVQHLETRMTDWIINGIPSDDSWFPMFSNYAHPRFLTHCLAYGVHPLSRMLPEPGNYRDSVGTGPWPTGNWCIKFSTAINKVAESANMVWDGVFPTMYAREADFDDGSSSMVDTGEADVDFTISWNYAFGFNPSAPDETFKSPVTWDKEKTHADVLVHIATQWFCRVDIYDFDSDGKPIFRFIPIGYSEGEFQVGALTDSKLQKFGQSSEDAIVTDSDGVKVIQRGFDGAVIAPSNSRNPVEIEIPFGTHAIAYESTPCFDASRLIINAKLPFHDQWKGGHRWAFGNETDLGEETVWPLNPDGWASASILRYYDSRTSNNHYPAKHNQDAFGFDIGYLYESEDEYHDGWHGYYPIHAIYDVDPADLTSEQKRERQKNVCISYALKYGRYIRGERRRLIVQFFGVVAPNWSDIKTGQTYQFTPTDTEITYVAVEIERDIENCITTVTFEEQAPLTLPMTYREEGASNEGNGSIGGNGVSGNDGTNGNNDTIYTQTVRNVKFYSGGSVQKEIVMVTTEWYDPVNEKVVVLQGTPIPFDPQGSDLYGVNAQFYFHYHGDTDNGDVEIVGVSQTDTPDHFASLIGHYKNGTADTDINYRLKLGRWSEDNADFIIERPLQAANVKPRIYVAGRFTCAVGLTTFDTFVWETFATNWPFSNDDCKEDIDLGYLGASAALPTLAAAAGNDGVIVTWGTPPNGRFKPVTIQANAWAYNALDTPGAGTSSHAWQVGAGPCMNQSPNVNTVKIPIWLNQNVLGVWNHVTKAHHTDLAGEAGLDILVFEFSGELEILGENAP